MRPYLLPGMGTLNDDLPVVNRGNLFKNQYDGNKLYDFIVESMTSANIIKKLNGEFIGVVFNVKGETNVVSTDDTSINISGLQGVKNENIRAYRIYIPEIHSQFKMPNDFYECDVSIGTVLPKVPFNSLELVTGDLVKIRFMDKENLKHPVGVEKVSTQPLDLRNPIDKVPKIDKVELQVKQTDKKVPEPTEPKKKVTDFQVYLGVPIPQEIRPLLEFIAKKESGGSYNAMNQVSTYSEDKNNNKILDSGEDRNNDGILDGPAVYGSTYDSVQAIGVKLTDLTFGEIRRRQKIAVPNPKKFFKIDKNKFHPERIFASGKYQFVSDALQGVMNNMNIPDNALYNERNQDSIALWLVKSRKPAWDYIFGRSDNINAAMHSLALAWASLPDPLKDGKSSYSENTANRAGHSLQEFSKLLKEVREKVTKMPPPPSQYC